MGCITNEWRGTADDLRRRVVPRDDRLVLEVPEVEAPDAAAPEAAAHTTIGPTGTVRFHAEHGPFRSYLRTVAWRTEDDGTVVVDQTVEWHLAIPYWAPLYAPVVRPALRDGIADGVRPWWSFPDRMSARQSRTAATMALFSLVSGLIYALLTQVLTFASADIGDGSSGEQATIFALVRIGAVLTAVVMVQADRVGRRRIAVWSFAIAAALSVATAFVPGLAALTVLQAVSRNLAVAGLLAVDTISVEELPAGSRAMAAGLSALAYGLGAGVVVISLPLADLAPWGWRLIFALSALTIPMIVSGSRNLDESGRFRELVASTSGRRVQRIRGSRFILLAALFLLVNLFIAPVSQLQNDYLRADRGFSGLTITLFTLATSTPAAIGVLVGGRLADGRGRRWALIPGLIALGVFTAAFFAWSGPSMWLSALLASVLGALTVAPLGVLAPELFPTARRGGARGALNVLAVTGSVIGLVAAGAGVDAFGYAPTFLLLAAGPLLAAGLAVAVPETRGRELEDLNRATGP